MRKIGKQPLRLSLIALMFIVVLSPLCSSVYAESEWYQVNLLIAYDEEWKAVAWSKYLYRPETLAYIFVDDIGYEFYRIHRIVFRIAEYMMFDSEDGDYDSEWRLREAIRETGFVSGQRQAGKVRHILIAFTAQRMWDAWGRANRTAGAVIVTELTWPHYTLNPEQYTDNILQHELSHLYECENHDIHGLQCVMNVWREHYGDVLVCLQTNLWCSQCIETVNLNRAKWGELSPSGGGGIL